MRYSQRIKWILAAVAMTGTVAADVIIDNQSIPGADIQSITIGPSSGDVFITTIDGYTVTKNDSPPPVDVAAITAFSASPSTINTGQSTNIVWTSVNTNSCQATGGTGGWASASVALNGSRDIVISEPGTYLFTLVCVGDSGTVQKQISVTAVTDTPPPGNCEASPLGGTTVEWASFWNDVPFPNPVFGSIFTEIPRNGYLAIKFNTANFVDTGLLATIETTATRGRRLGAVSTCPGDFDVVDECREIWGNGGDIIWTTDGYGGACELQPNTTYYFNITFTDGVDPASTECVSQYCITKARAKNP